MGRHDDEWVESLRGLSKGITSAIFQENSVLEGREMNDGIMMEILKDACGNLVDSWGRFL